MTEDKIYRLLMQEDWEALIDFLHLEKEYIKEDTRLIYIAKLIEDEFVRKVKEYPIDRKDIKIVLEKFYQLDAGKFHKLSQENLEAVYEEMADRMPESYSGFSKKNRKKRDQQEIGEVQNVAELPEKINIPANWTQMFNRLFEVIDVKNDPETYFSGPRFINLVRKYEPYHADYIQYKNNREHAGKSMTRKVFFEDILKELSDSTRKKVLDNMISILEPYDKDRIAEIRFLLYGKEYEKTLNISVPERKPIVFISYSWDDEDHKTWVLKLANKLISDEIDVRIDRQILRVGSSLQFTMEQSIEQADKVLIIFTPNYKLKADKRTGGVGYEYSIMNSALYNNQTVNSKILPVLRRGSKSESIPAFMQQYVHLDLREDSDFEINYNDLKHELMNII